MNVVAKVYRTCGEAGVGVLDLDVVSAPPRSASCSGVVDGWSSRVRKYTPRNVVRQRSRKDISREEWVSYERHVQLGGTALYWAARSRSLSGEMSEWNTNVSVSRYFAFSILITARSKPGG